MMVRLEQPKNWEFENCFSIPVINCFAVPCLSLAWIVDDSLVGQLTNQALPIVFVPGNAMLEQNTIATSYFSPEHLSQSSAAMVGHC